MPWTAHRMTIQDYELWQRLMRENADNRRAAGAKSYHLLRSDMDPHDVMIIHEWDDLEAARRWFTSEPFHANVQKHGGQNRILYFSEYSER